MLLQVYVIAPPPVKVRVSPAQRLVLLAFAATVGALLMIKLAAVEVAVPAVAALSYAFAVIDTVPEVAGVHE